MLRRCPKHVITKSKSALEVYHGGLSACRSFDLQCLSLSVCIESFQRQVSFENGMTLSI